MVEFNEIVVNPLRAPFRKAIKTALKRVAKKCEKLEGEILECKKADYYLECGEILKANLSLVKRGMSIVELPDMYNEGQMREIELDKHLKPLENAKKFFKRQRKLHKGQLIIESQLVKAQEKYSEIADLLEKYLEWEEEVSIDTVPSDEFVAIAKDLKIHISGLEPKKPPVSKKNAVPNGVRIFESHDNMVIYVGKNAKDNDNLSIRVARGNDWWFHVAGVQGSHVLVRLESKVQGLALPQETLLDAATLAVYYSKARKATRADVHYTQAKNIRKAKKSPPGQVIVSNGKTLNVRIEEDRLDRLLKREVF